MQKRDNTKAFTLLFKAKRKKSRNYMKKLKLKQARLNKSYTVNYTMKET